MRSIPIHLRYLGMVYLLCILVFGLFRLLLLLTNIEQISLLPEGEKTILLLRAFFMGLRYDTVILGYVFSLPFLLLTFNSFANKPNRLAYKISTIYLSVLLSICFLICCVDIPFFNHFGEHLTTAVFAWSDSPVFVAGMIFSEPRFFGYLFPFIISVLFLVIVLKRIKNQFLSKPYLQQSLFTRSAFFVLFSFVLFIAIRGRLNQKSPINEGTAFFSAYPLPNYLGLNPVFTLAKSIRHQLDPDNKTLQLIDPQTAVYNARRFLNINEQENSEFPLARKVMPADTALKANVIIVIMEGISTFWMGEYGGPQGLTPNLDSLARHSLSFKNIYTAGTHTHNGIYSTLFSFPALMKKHPMYAHFDFPHTGIASILKDQGYNTLFFTTHDEQFDNTGGFLLKNGFDRIISEKDYPKKEVISTLGVPDHYLFSNSINILNNVPEEENFLAVYMTASNHGPYILPPDIDFTPKQSDLKEQLVAYSDWAIGQFLLSASKQRWFNNTIFVFVADHGLNMGHTYDMPLSFHHTPLIIHAPGIIGKAEVNDCIGGQIDIAPTLLGILNTPYTNNTEGIDLLHEIRPFIFFSGDEKIGCLDKTHFYIYRKNGIETLYEYKNLSTTNFLDAMKTKADSMKNYAFSMMQCAEWIIENKKAGKENRTTNIATDGK